jgi:D-tyrosyl-tRNA(Tyr) deacylase
VRLVIQRVARAAVTVEGREVGRIGRGLAVLVGVAQGDTVEAAERLAKKTAELRIFPDAAGRFQRSALDLGAEVLVVSQFTLLADTRKGRRPSFVAAAAPEQAEPLVEAYRAALERLGLRTASGQFGAHMLVDLVNDGPVTLILNSAEPP